MSEEAAGCTLVVDDDHLMRAALRVHLGRMGYRVEEASSGAQALGALASLEPDLVLLDLQLEDTSGLAVLETMRERGDQTPVIVLTAHGSHDAILEAERLGAAAFLTKPVNLGELRSKVGRCRREANALADVQARPSARDLVYGNLVGSSQAMKRVLNTLRRLESVPAPTVLLSGPSGTGKNLVAQAIHSGGPRRDEPFMEVDCSALPETLFESELFGHQKGAFTDAKALKRGLFEVAGSGTIFLDEIGELPLGTQAKLLRALENRSFKRVGGLEPLPLRAAIVAATNRALPEEVAAGRFREDLYYRLNVLGIRMPSLAEHLEDLEEIANHLLLGLNRELGSRLEGLTSEALEVMRAYSWPGNVRELRNVLERTAILGAEGRIYPSDLPLEIRFAKPEPERQDDDTEEPSAKATAQDAPRPPRPDDDASASSFVLPEGGVNLEELERDLLVQALERTGGKKAQAAKLLGISRHALRYRLQKAGLEPNSKRP